MYDEKSALTPHHESSYHVKEKSENLESDFWSYHALTEHRDHLITYENNTTFRLLFKQTTYFQHSPLIQYMP